MSAFCITFSVIKVTTLHFTLHVDSTGFRASKLVNNAGEVNRIESFQIFWGEDLRNLSPIPTPVHYSYLLCMYYQQYCVAYSAGVVISVASVSGSVSVQRPLPVLRGDSIQLICTPTDDVTSGSGFSATWSHNGTTLNEATTGRYLVP